MVPDEEDQFKKIDLVKFQAMDQGRRRLQVQSLPQEDTGVRTETVIEYLPCVQEIRDEQFVPHMIVDPAKLNREAFHILVTIIQEPVYQLNERLVGGGGKDGIHGDRCMVKLEITDRVTADPGRIKTLIRERRECITMKCEDADWKIYHLIPPESPIAVEDLTRKSGLEPSAVDDSLSRLEHYCLVERTGGEVRMLNFGEALIRNQLKYDDALPYTIENGVIKARK